MKIVRMKANHITEPVGYRFEPLTLTWTAAETDAARTRAARVEISEDAEFSALCFDSGFRNDIRGIGFRPAFVPEAGKRYFWRVAVQADNGESAVSDAASFETAKPGAWTAKWIAPVTDRHTQVIVYSIFRIEKPVRRARAYLCGLGLYELYLNSEKVGHEVLMPGFCPYDAYIPYQTYPLEVEQGENIFEIMLGDGWYKGWYGLKKKYENYGTRLACIAEIHIEYEDGTRQVIASDETWKAKRSPVTCSGIYPGEVYEPATDAVEVFDTETVENIQVPEARIDPPITVNERLKPVQLIRTPAGETVLDMGQNMVGWLGFRCEQSAGTQLIFEFGEILQDGCFYRDNLRTADAQFVYVSDGVPRYVRQHFTFYGFRYVKISGWKGEIDPNDFEGLVIHSQLDRIGFIETSDPLVNQLVKNIWWGQRGNFLDIPTDCPQRDERCGWTGDAQIFSGTACYNSDVYAFYTKFGRDLWEEQKKKDGAVPDTVPTANYTGNTSAAWGDAAVIIPWNVYLHTGDPAILEQQFESMHGWVDYITREDEKHGCRHLWQSGFHYGDWLALDGNIAGGVYGATDPFLIASAYYYYSANITAKAAHVLGREAEAAYYGKLAGQIREAFIREYYTPSGRLCVDTMTAYAVVLKMDLVPGYALNKTRRGLLEKMKKNFFHLNTGFVGTPYLCGALSDNGMTAIAYQLLMEKGYPGWLYEVLMGATTVWERWNSVNPDGSISGTEMNSLNHYAYGSIAEWLYGSVCGLKPMEEAPGFARFTFAPKIDPSLQWAKCTLDSSAGRIESRWAIEGESIALSLKIPFDAQADILLPDAHEDVQIPLSVKVIGRNEEGLMLRAGSGTWAFCYAAPGLCRRRYGIDSAMADLMDNPETRRIVEEEYYSRAPLRPFEKELCTLRELMNGPFTNVSYEVQDEIDRMLKRV